MILTDEELARLSDVVRLQPTKNSELEEAWGLESGSEVHSYLESHLSEHYYRDDNSLIRANADAAELVDVKPGMEGGRDGTPDVIRVPKLQLQVYEVIAGPDDRSESVVSVLKALRETHDSDPEVDSVREALHSLKRKDVVEVEYRTVPTFRLVAPRDAIDVELES